MGKKIFVSYSHRQAEWVRDRLCPVLKAWGAEILIDYKRFEAGGGVYQQMDATQDLADVHLLLLSPEYLGSKPCVHEMERALATDPTFAGRRVLPVVRVECAVPATIQNAIYVDLADDTKADQWDLVTAKSGAPDLGVSAAEWLRVRQRIVDWMLDGQSVNVVVKGKLDRNALFAQVREDTGGMTIIDLERGSTAGRQGLITEIRREIGLTGEARKPPNDLADLERGIASASSVVRLAFCHGDIFGRRRRNYKDDFFSAIKNLVSARRLVLLVESNAPFAEIVPSSNPISSIPFMTVELRGRV